MAKLPNPFTRISLFCGSYDIKILWVFHWGIAVLANPTSIFFEIIEKSCSRLSRSDRTAKNAAVMELIDGLELIVIQEWFTFFQLLNIF